MGIYGGIGVLGTGSHLPDRVRTNEEVAAACAVSTGWIVERTGVRRRHAAAAGEATSDLAVAAGGRALSDAELRPDEIGLLVVATSMPDDFGPSTACRVQVRLGASRAAAFDLGAACTGFFYALRVAHDWLVATGGGEGYALVIGAESYSRFVDPADRATAVLFGDGAAAAVLGPVRPGYGFSEFSWGADGSQADHVLVPAGGSRRPATGQTLADGAHYLRMDGRAVAAFIADVFPRLLASGVRSGGVKLADVDVLISHQPNPALLRRVAEAAGVRPDQLHIIGDRVGNLGAASIAYALADAAEQGRLADGSLALLTGFGAGVTWGSVMLRCGGSR
ncbi:beta-ketoacyl-ACP synthase 3 [Plantactinospora sp. ZYX-F-223]|uniref:3-oxoacyl-ACP synthase III family protein n=1 Tax=Plantactinospora sp. ZYX-F-223 TaxID=3144103 RepID=UPI0031FC72E1